MTRVLSITVLLGLAAVIALVGSHLIHSDLGVASSTIRYDSVAAAGFLSVVWALGFMTGKN